LPDQTDIYFVLLGLPEGPRPPDHYTLLELPPLASDVRKVHAAVERQLAKLTPLLMSPQGRKAQRMIGELLHARDVLTSRRRKQAYDAELLGAGLLDDSATPGDQDSGSMAPGTAATAPVLSLSESQVNDGLIPGPLENVDALLPPPAYEPSIGAQSLASPAPSPESTAEIFPPLATPSPLPNTVPYVTPSGASGLNAIGELSPTPLPGAPFTPHELIELPSSSLTPASGEWPSAISRLPTFGAALSSGTSAAASQESQRLMLFIICAVIAGAAIVAGAALLSGPRSGARMANSAGANPTTENVSKTIETPAKAPPVRPNPKQTPSKSPPKLSDTNVSTIASTNTMPAAETGATTTESAIEPRPPAAPATPEPEVTPAGPAPVAADPKQVATVRTSLTVARAALAKRDLPAASKELDLALVQASTADLITEVEATKALHHYLDGFWGSVRDRMKGMGGGEELTIGERVVIVVEVDGGRVTVRDRGANKTYNLRDMPASLAAAIAESWLKKEDPNSAVFIGAFWAIDGKGDEKRGRQILADAKKSGVEAAGDLLDALGPAK